MFSGPDFSSLLFTLQACRCSWRALPRNDTTITHYRCVLKPQDGSRCLVMEHVNFYCIVHFFHSRQHTLWDLTVKDCGWRLPLRLSSRSLTLAMDTMREAALYSVSKWLLMQDTAWSTFATLPLAKAKASRVISASGLTQQLHGSRKEEKQVCLVFSRKTKWHHQQSLFQIKHFLREFIMSHNHTLTAWWEGQFIMFERSCS